MEVVSFKCPNCGANWYLIQILKTTPVLIVNSEFSQEQIDTMQKGKQPSQESEAAGILQKGRNRKKRRVCVPELWSRDCDRSDNSGHRMLLLSESGGIIGKSFRRVSAQEIIPFAIDRKKARKSFTEYEKEEICSPWILQRKTD